MKKETIVRRTWIWANFILISLLGLALTGTAQDEIWERRKDIPTPYTEEKVWGGIGWMGDAMVEGRFYLIGGWDGNSSRFFAVYHTQTDTWIIKEKLPELIFSKPVFSVAACAVNGEIYVIGGAEKGYEID